MNALPLQAATSRQRASFWAPHPVELAIFVALAALAHFVWNQPIGEALWVALVAFSLLPRAEIWDISGQWRWSWIVWRWLSVSEILLGVFSALWFHRSGQNVWLTGAQVAGFLLLARLLAALADYAVYRYPPGARIAKIVNWICVFVAAMFLARALWTTNWNEIALAPPDFSAIRSYRPDWRGASGVLFMGMVAVLFFGPPLEVWNRALKPFDKRADLTLARRARAALVYIAACGVWWAFLVAAIYQICSQPNLSG